jgi:hypothetical protein
MLLDTTVAVECRREWKPTSFVALRALKVDFELEREKG